MKRKINIKECATYAICAAVLIVTFLNKDIVAKAVNTAASFGFNVSSNIASSGRMILNTSEGALLADIDADEIKNNRDGIKKLGGQLGWDGTDTKIFFYNVGDKIYMVTGTHTILTDSMDSAERISVINAEKSGDNTIMVDGEEISLTGNTTWMQVK